MENEKAITKINGYTIKDGVLRERFNGVLETIDDNFSALEDAITAVDNKADANAADITGIKNGTIRAHSSSYSAVASSLAVNENTGTYNIIGTSGSGNNKSIYMDADVKFNTDGAIYGKTIYEDGTSLANKYGVTVTPSTTSGTKIADIKVGGTTKTLYAPQSVSGNYLPLTGGTVSGDIYLQTNRGETDRKIGTEKLSDDSQQAYINFEGSYGGIDIFGRKQVKLDGGQSTITLNQAGINVNSSTTFDGDIQFSYGNVSEHYIRGGGEGAYISFTDDGAYTEVSSNETVLLNAPTIELKINNAFNAFYSDTRDTKIVGVYTLNLESTATYIRGGQGDSVISLTDGITLDTTRGNQGSGNPITLSANNGTITITGNKVYITGDVYTTDDFTFNGEAIFNNVATFMGDVDIDAPTTILAGNTLKLAGTTNADTANIKFGTVGGKTPYIGYATNQVDGTFAVMSIEGTTYQSGLAIGGSSGNLLWKGAKVATVSDIPSKVSDLTNDSSYATTSDVNTALSNAKSYTDTKVASLVGSAPDTLDTLEELADALKDNKDIVTVLEDSIASKADKTSLNSYVTLSTAQTITGAKTFNGAHSFTGETKFTNSGYCPTFSDIASGIGKSSCFTRGAHMQVITGQILAPTAGYTDEARGYETETGTIKFQHITATTGGQPTVSDMATLSYGTFTVNDGALQSTNGDGYIRISAQTGISHNLGGEEQTVFLPLKSGYLATTDDIKTYSFSAYNPTLAWGTTSTIGTAGGTTYKVTMPANPNTDTGATSVAVSGSGNAVTTASYDASTRKLTLTKGTTFLTAHQDISGKANLSGGNTFTGTQVLNSPSSGGYSINASGYVKGQYLQSEARQQLSSVSDKVCVFDGSGWIYYNTPAQLAVKGGAVTKVKINGETKSPDSTGLVDLGTISSSGGTSSYTLPEATSSALGGIKIGYSANGKNYPVQLSNGQAYVNVPWTDTNTTYSAATSSALGLVKIGSNITNSSGAISLTKANVTSALGYTPMNSSVANFELNNSGSLKNYGGFIDFHFHNSDGQPTNASGTVVDTTPDYTSRIIENAAGQIDINGVKMKNSTVTGSLSGNASTATKLATERTLSFTNDATGSMTFDGSANASATLTLKNSGVTAGSYGQSANATPTPSSSFSVPYITVDAKGRVTAASTKTITLPGNPAYVANAYNVSLNSAGSSTTYALAMVSNNSSDTTSSVYRKVGTVTWNGSSFFAPIASTSTSGTLSANSSTTATTSSALGSTTYTRVVTAYAYESTKGTAGNLQILVAGTTRAQMSGEAAYHGQQYLCCTAIVPKGQQVAIKYSATNTVYYYIAYIGG